MDMPSISQQLMIAPPAVKSPPYAIAIRKGDTAVREALRSALRAIIADGTYDKFLAKWDLQDFAMEAADVNGHALTNGPYADRHGGQACRCVRRWWSRYSGP